MRQILDQRHWPVETRQRQDRRLYMCDCTFNSCFLGQMECIWPLHHFGVHRWRGHDFHDGYWKCWCSGHCARLADCAGGKDYSLLGATVAIEIKVNYCICIFLWTCDSLDVDHKLLWTGGLEDIGWSQNRTLKYQFSIVFMELWTIKFWVSNFETSQTAHGSISWCQLSLALAWGVVRYLRNLRAMIFTLLHTLSSLGWALVARLQVAMAAMAMALLVQELVVLWCSFSPKFSNRFGRFSQWRDVVPRGLEALCSFWAWDGGPQWPRWPWWLQSPAPSGPSSPMWMARWCLSPPAPSCRTATGQRWPRRKRRAAPFRSPRAAFLARGMTRCAPNCQVFWAQESFPTELWFWKVMKCSMHQCYLQRQWQLWWNVWWMVVCMAERLGLWPWSPLMALNIASWHLRGQRGSHDWSNVPVNLWHPEGLGISGCCRGRFTNLWCSQHQMTPVGLQWIRLSHCFARSWLRLLQC